MRRSAIVFAGFLLAGTAFGDEVKPASRFAVQPSDDGTSTPLAGRATTCSVAGEPPRFATDRAPVSTVTAAQADTAARRWR